MFTLRMPARARGDGTGTGTGTKTNPTLPDEARNASLLEGELLDLYAAILIAVPLAWFLRSLWS
jgi:hypothetical protein